MKDLLLPDSSSPLFVALLICMGTIIGVLWKKKDPIHKKRGLYLLGSFIITFALLTYFHEDIIFLLTRGDKNSNLFQGLFTLLLGAFPAYLIWIWRTEDKQKELAHREQEIEIDKDHNKWESFLKLQELASDKGTQPMTRASAIYSLQTFLTPTEPENHFSKLTFYFFRDFLNHYWQAQEQQIANNPGALLGDVEVPIHIEAIYEVIADELNNNNLRQFKEFKNWSFLKAKFNDVDFSGMDIVNCDFSSAILRDITFSTENKSSEILKTSFKNTSLICTYLNCAKIHNSQFYATLIWNTYFDNAKISGTIFNNASISETRFKETIFKNCTFYETIFYASKIEDIVGPNFIDIDIKDCYYNPEKISIYPSPLEESQDCIQIYPTEFIGEVAEEIKAKMRQFKSLDDLPSWKTTTSGYPT